MKSKSFYFITVFLLSFHNINAQEETVPVATSVNQSSGSNSTHKPHSNFIKPQSFRNSFKKLYASI